MLEISDLCAGYGGVPALRSIDFRVGQQEHVAILGPNGAGKTTLLKTISGTVEADSGTIRLDGQDLLSQAAHKRVEAGIVHVPQGRMIFASMTVADNLRLGGHRDAARRRHDERLALVQERFGVSMGTGGGPAERQSIRRGLERITRSERPGQALHGD